MKRWERIAFNLTALVVVATGFAYLWMKYFVQSEDPFAVVNHPWETSMLALHVLASPPFILLFGIILNSHIMKKLRSYSVRLKPDSTTSMVKPDSTTRIPNRRSGLFSLVTFAAMVCSGYMLQVVTTERGLHALVAVHLASGILFTGAYAIHLIISSRLVRRPFSSSAIRQVA